MYMRRHQLVPASIIAYDYRRLIYFFVSYAELAELADYHDLEDAPNPAVYIYTAA